MRKALIIGIDHYLHMAKLSGCVSDAHEVKNVLEHHHDGTVNFATPRLLTGTGPANIVKRGELKDAVRELFADASEIALFYFAGHGYIEDTGGFLCTSDSERGDDGFPIDELMKLATASIATNKVIILDSCHSGIAGEHSAEHRGCVAEARHDDYDGIDREAAREGSNNWWGWCLYQPYG